MDESETAAGKVVLFDRLSSVAGRVREHCSAATGLLENQARTWLCVFRAADCEAGQLYPVGATVQLNASLVSGRAAVQYLASGVWPAGGAGHVLAGSALWRRMSARRASNTALRSAASAWAYI